MYTFAGWQVILCDPIQHVSSCRLLTNGEPLYRVFLLNLFSNINSTTITISAVKMLLLLTIRWALSAIRPEYNIVEGISRTHACKRHYHIILNSTKFMLNI